MEAPPARAVEAQVPRSSPGLAGKGADAGPEPASVDPALQAFYQRVTPPGMEPEAFIPFWPSAWKELQWEKESP